MRIHRQVMIRIIVLDDDFIMVLKPRSDLLVQLGHAARSLFNPCLDSLSFWTTQLRRGGFSKFRDPFALQGDSRDSHQSGFYRGSLEKHPARFHPLQPPALQQLRHGKSSVGFRVSGCCCAWLEIRSPSGAVFSGVAYNVVTYCCQCWHRHQHATTRGTLAAQDTAGPLSENWQ